MNFSNNCSKLLKVFSLVGVFFTNGFLLAQPAIESASTTNKHKMLTEMPIRFTENKGQVADLAGKSRPDVLFTANKEGVKLFMTANGIHYQFSRHFVEQQQKAGNLKGVNAATMLASGHSNFYRLDLSLVGANLSPTIVKEGKGADVEHFFLAHCPQGIQGVNNYEKIVFKDVYPNIDWVVYAKGNSIEYDFKVHPGGKVADIQLKYDGAAQLKVDEKGNLSVTTPLGTLQEQKPYSFQSEGIEVSSQFVVKGNTFGFEVLGNNPTEELTIDPSVAWATYYGGTDTDVIMSCNSDASNNVYFAGSTYSTTGIASGGHQNSIGALPSDAFLAKFNGDGVRQWATYYGGEGIDGGNGCAVDFSGNVFLAGVTNSLTGIASLGYQTTYGGGLSDAFLVKFNSSGVRQYATYYGGTGIDIATSCASNFDGSAIYISGYTNSTASIASGGSLQSTYGGGTYDGFIIKFTGSTGARSWGSYYGGANSDVANACLVDLSGNVFVAGTTASTTGIAASGHQNTHGGGTNDAFLLKLLTGGTRSWATYYGGSGEEEGFDCVPDGQSFHNVYLSGSTTSTTNISTLGAYQTALGGGKDAFLAKFSNTAGTRTWGTYFGGLSDDQGYSCTVEVKTDFLQFGTSNVYLAGTTSSTTQIASSGYQNTIGGNTDGYIVKFSTAGAFAWSTYHGGILLDEIRASAGALNGIVYVGGYTNSPTFIASGGSQNTYGGGTYDGFLVKISDQSTPVPTITSFTPQNGIEGASFTITGTNFIGATSVLINTTSVTTFTVNSSTEITATVPAGATTGKVWVITPGGIAQTTAEFIILPSPVIVWTGATNTDWHTTTNWLPNQIPTATDNVYVPNLGGINYPQIAAANSGAFNQLAIQTNGGIGISGTLQANGNITNLGQISVNGTGVLELKGSTNATTSIVNSASSSIIFSGGAAQVIPANAFASNKVFNLTINNATGVTLNGTLSIENELNLLSGTFTTNNNLTILSTDSRIGQIKGSYALLSGNVTIQTYLNSGRKWRLLGIPVTGSATLRDYFMGGSAGTDLTIAANRNAQTTGKGTIITGNVFTTAVDANTAGYDWIGVANVSALRSYVGNTSGGSFAGANTPALSTTLSAAEQGYMLFARGDRKINPPNDITKSSSTILEVAGVIRSGTQNLSLPAATTASHTILGNPYPAAIDFGAFVNDANNTGKLERYFWTWEPTLTGVNGQGGYKLVTETTPGSNVWIESPTVGLSSIPNLIQRSQAVFIEPVLGTTQNLTIEESMVSANSTIPAPLGGNTSDLTLLNINVLTQSSDNWQIGDGVTARFSDGFSQQVLGKEDIKKLSHFGSLLSLQRNNALLALESRPTVFDVDTLFLRMGSLAAGNYQLTITAPIIGSNAVRAVLQDTWLNTEVEIVLNDSTKYTFSKTGDASLDENRFRVVLQKAGTLACTFVSLAVKEKEQTQHEVLWQTTQETNMKSFAVQQSTDGIHFVTIATVPAKGLLQNAYSAFVQHSASGNVWYRIQGIGNNGTITFSQIVAMLQKTKGKNISLAYNPISINQPIILQLQQVPAGNFGYQLYDQQGRVFATGKFVHTGGNAAIRVGTPAILSAGKYQLVCNSGTEKVTLSILVQ